VSRSKSLYDSGQCTGRSYEYMQQLETQLAVAREENTRLRDELRVIAEAKPDTWGHRQNTFGSWAQRRARKALNQSYD